MRYEFEKCWQWRAKFKKKMFIVKDVLGRRRRIRNCGLKAYWAVGNWRLVGVPGRGSKKRGKNP